MNIKGVFLFGFLTFQTILVGYLIGSALTTPQVKQEQTTPATTPVTVQQWECYATMKTTEATDGL